MINDSKIKNIRWIVICAVCVLAVGFAVLKSSGKPAYYMVNALDDEVYMLKNGTHPMHMRLEEMLREVQIIKLSDEEIKDLFEGRQLAVLGDSISTYEGWIPKGYGEFFPMEGEVYNVDETWWKMLIDETGMQFCANSSSAGSTCAGDSLSKDNPKYACSNYRIDALIGNGGVYPDIIIVYMGTNDLLISVPLGENDGTQPVDEGIVETFSDAYTLILDKLESQYPGAQVFCCTLTQIGDWGITQPFETFVNSLNLDARDYSRQIETIAGNRGIDVIDLINCGITPDNMPQYVTDGVHLNPEGMKLVKDAVKYTVAESFY